MEQEAVSCTKLSLVSLKTVNLKRFLTDQLLSSKNPWTDEGSYPTVCPSTVTPLYERTVRCAVQYEQIDGSYSRMLSGIKDNTIQQVVFTNKARVLQKGEGQKPNHCRVASLTFQGQDCKYKITQFQGQEYLQSKMLL